MARFTEAQVTEVFEKLVADRDDNWAYSDEYQQVTGLEFDGRTCEYVTCTNTETEEFAPLCVVGQIIYALAPEEAEKLYCVFASATALSGGLADVEPMGDLFPPEVWQGLISAQESQDELEPWGKALSEYKEQVTN